MRYVGWGGLPQAFDLENTAWKDEAEELRQLLTVEEYAAARRSTQDAHYTSQEVIEGIYRGLDRLGFQGPSRILEPSAGIGHFCGLRPEALRDGQNRVVAVELDHLSAAIGHYLYPDVQYLNQGFQDIVLPDKDIDLAIGNPPFGNQRIYDPHHPGLDFSVHNFFLSKSINSLREGGIAAFVVSRYFMDAANNPAREYIAERANLLGAIRLPNTAFKRNALTEVTTDIVFFERTNEPELDPAWLKTGEILDPDGNETVLNQYYIDHPEQMIGQMTMTSGMFGNSADLLPPPDFAGFEVEIGQRLEILPQEIYRPRTDLVLDVQEEREDPNLEICAKLKVDAYFITAEGDLARRRANILNIPSYERFDPRNKRAGERITGMIKLRDALSDLMVQELREDAKPYDLEELRKNLNRLYDDFQRRHGYINSMANRQAMRDDPDFPLLTSLEREYDPGISPESAQKTGHEPRPPFASKADIFSKRVLEPRRKIERVDTPKEALIVSMNEYGRPDLDFMSGLCGKSTDDLASDLAGLIYLNPVSRAWELADHYLTGDVKTKLKQAEEVAKGDLRFKANVEALREVQPPDLEPVDISVQLGSTWVPPEVVADFARHLLGESSVLELGYHPALGSWVTRFSPWAISDTANESTWGTSRYPAHALIDSILNNTTIKVMDEIGRDPETKKPILKLNEDETAAANQKADDIRQAFVDWIWKEQDRREMLARLYNDRFNTHVPRKYNGSHLELPGSAVNVTLRPHQKDAIWRGIQDGGMLADMVVGAGKTWVIVGTLMESRRMGLMKKPMVVVPNHLLAQWQDAFYTLYPQARVLVADKNDFKKEQRQQLFAKIATGDWDAVVVAHSSFKKIGLPPETLQSVLTEQIDDLTEAIAAAKEQSGKRSMVKAMEKTRDRLKAKMQRRADTGQKDKMLTFADLGVDALVVDESQNFKNLYITTGLRNVAGLGNLTGSAQAFDLFVKARYLQKKHDGRGLFFATGTPVSNSIAELYSIQRFMSYDTLKEKGLTHFDAWASTFGQVVTGWELDATGVGYKVNSRFSKFQNMPELVNMYRTFADVITNEDIVAQNQGQVFNPKIAGGRPLNLVKDRSPQQAAYMGIQYQARDSAGNPMVYPDGRPLMRYPKGSIIHRMENLPKDPRIDNPLKITNDARKAGLDFRLVDPSTPDFEGSKTSAAADNIFRVWRDWREDKGTQLVFCDLSTPKMTKANPKPLGAAHAQDISADGSDHDDDEPVISMDEILAGQSKFSVYDDLKTKLVEKGIPSDEIRFIHEANTDAQKAKLFDEVNQGKVRVLMGSTAKMGAGTNVQRRLVALHHLDCPWRPSDLSQREGRIIRQGNMFHKRDPEGFEVEIVRYATKQTYDARMWQVIEGKANSIEIFRKGDSLTRVIDDVASEAANAAEMKAAATGNELIFLQVKLASELKKVEGVFTSFQRSQHQLEKRIASLEAAPERAAKEVERWRQEIELRDSKTTKQAYFAVGGNLYDEKNRGDLLLEMARAMKASVERPEQPQKIGQYRGFNIHVESQNKSCQFVLEGQAGYYTPLSLHYPKDSEFSINGFLQRLDNYLNKFEVNITEVEKDLERKKTELVTARQSQGQPFPQADILNALRQDNREVLRELQLMQNDPSYKSEWEPQSLKIRESKSVAKEPANEKCPSAVSEPSNDSGVAWIHVGNLGAFPVFDDRAMMR